VRQGTEHPLVVVAGPTGSGKSDLSLYLASELDGEIVNCDSLQVYRYFNIGTAKVPLSERRGIAHHLMDFLDPNEPFTAGDYAHLARQTLAGIAGRGKAPVIVGGTGFYLSALIEGLFEGPSRNDELRQRLAAREKRRPGSIHRLLRRLDPETAGRIHPRDVNKTIRALEITVLARRPASEMFAGGRSALQGYRIVKLGLNPPREELYRRLDLRTAAMFQAGLVAEVQEILGRGFSQACKPFESLGYRQALMALRGELTLAEAVELSQRDTRRYAKRQLTWFRRDKEMKWLDGFGDDHRIQVLAALEIKHLQK